VGTRFVCGTQVLAAALLLLAACCSGSPVAAEARVSFFRPDAGRSEHCFGQIYCADWPGRSWHVSTEIRRG
jgi:hypothetical protein